VFDAGVRCVFYPACHLEPFDRPCPRLRFPDEVLNHGYAVTRQQRQLPLSPPQVGNTRPVRHCQLLREFSVCVVAAPSKAEPPHQASPYPCTFGRQSHVAQVVQCCEGSVEQLIDRDTACNTLSQSLQARSSSALEKVHHTLGDIIS
jgi:hypothetical protein